MIDRVKVLGTTNSLALREFSTVEPCEKGVAFESKTTASISTSTLAPVSGTTAATTGPSSNRAPIGLTLAPDGRTAKGNAGGRIMNRGATLQKFLN